MTVAVKEMPDADIEPPPLIDSPVGLAPLALATEMVLLLPVADIEP